MKLSAGEALAAAGLLVAGVTLLDQTGPGFGTSLTASPADRRVRAHLTSAELGTAATIAAAAAVAAILTRAPWPLAVGLVAIVLAICVHELALRLDPEAD